MSFYDKIIPEPFILKSVEKISYTKAVFEHNYYNKEGENVARCEMMGGWMNLKTRKLTGLPEDMLNEFKSSYKTDSFKEITSKDTRRWNKEPKNLIK